MNAVQFLRLLRMACWALMQLAVTPAVFGVLWIAMAGCAGAGWGRPGEYPSGPARTARGVEPELAHVKIEVERLSVSAEINAAGEFTDGLDDDPFWYRVCLPECPPLELREDVAARCFLEFVPAPGGTEVRFRAPNKTT